MRGTRFEVSVEAFELYLEKTGQLNIYWPTQAPGGDSDGDLITPRSRRTKFPEEDNA